MTMEEIKRVMEEIGGLQRYEPIEFGYSGSRHYSPTNIQRSDDGDFVRLEEVLSKFSALEARMQAMEKDLEQLQYISFHVGDGSHAERMDILARKCGNHIGDWRRAKAKIQGTSNTKEAQPTTDGE